MKTTQVFSGQAQLPAGSDIYENYKFITVLAEIDVRTGVIVNIVVPIYCKIHNDFVANIAIGKSLHCDFEAIITEIDERVHTVTKRALINALQVLFNRYEMVKNKSLSKVK